MASMWKKAMTYLGLGDDEDYADFEVDPEPRRAPLERRSVREPARPPAGGPPERRGPREVPDVRDPRDRDPRDPRSPGAGLREEASDVRVRGPVRPVGAERVDASSGVGAVTSRSAGGGLANRGAVVRPLPIPVSAKPHVVHPTSFNGAQEVADLYKGDLPVVMNLQEVDRDLSRRLIDFASGLCYGLGGSMDRVANGVYLLTPADVTVSEDDKRRLGFTE